MQTIITIKGSYSDLPDILRERVMSLGYGVVVVGEFLYVMGNQNSLDETPGTLTVDEAQEIIVLGAGQVRIEAIEPEPCPT